MSLIVGWYVSSIMSDATFLFLTINATLLWPLAYAKKRSQIDKILGLINLKIDEKLDKISFLKALQPPKKEESKKDK